MYIDSQILIDAFNSETNIGAVKISSVVASEFLGLYLKNDMTHATFYPFLLFPIFHTSADLGQSHSRNISKHYSRAHSMMTSKNHSDQIVLELGSQFGRVIEFGSIALSEIIRTKNITSVYISIRHLSKRKQKQIIKKIKYLLDQEIVCTPINQEIIDITKEILYQLPKNINLKANFHNSLNDLLIYSTALCNHEELYSKDKLLIHEIAKIKPASIAYIDSNFLQISFTNLNPDTEKSNSESRGYINRSWLNFIKKISR